MCERFVLKSFCIAEVFSSYMHLLIKKKAKSAWVANLTKSRTFFMQEWQVLKYLKSDHVETSQEIVINDEDEKINISNMLLYVMLLHYSFGYCKLRLVFQYQVQKPGTSLVY